jgi:hypothetical protein
VIDLVGADNRILYISSRSRTVVNVSKFATPHDADLGQLTIDHGEQRAAAVAACRAALEPSRRHLRREIEEVWIIR